MGAILLLGAEKGSTGEIKGYSFYFEEFDEVREYSPLTTAIILNKILRSNRTTSKRQIQNMLHIELSNLNGGGPLVDKDFATWKSEDAYPNFLMYSKDMQYVLSESTVFVLEVYHYKGVLTQTAKVVVHGEKHSRVMRLSELQEYGAVFGITLDNKKDKYTYKEIARYENQDLFKLVEIEPTDDFATAVDSELSAFDITQTAWAHKSIVEFECRSVYPWKNLISAGNSSVVSMVVGYEMSKKNKGILVFSEYGKPFTEQEKARIDATKLNYDGFYVVCGLYMYKGAPLFVEVAKREPIGMSCTPGASMGLLNTEIHKVTDVQKAGLDINNLLTRVFKDEQYANSINRYELTLKQDGEKA